MSEPRDREWDDELRALADVRERYRTAVRGDTPPETLDAAILAASRRAVGAGPRAAGPCGVARWRAPLAAAAMIVLSVSVAWWRLDGGTWSLPREVSPEMALPDMASAGTRVAEVAPDVDPGRSALGPSAERGQEEGAQAARPAASGSAPTETALLSKRAADVALAQPQAQVPSQSPTLAERDAMRAHAEARRDAAPDESLGASPVAPGPGHARESVGSAASDAAPKASEPSDFARAPAAPEAAAPAAAAPPPGDAMIAAAPTRENSVQATRREPGESAEEPRQSQVLSGARALTRVPGAADRAKSAPAAAAAAPRVGGHDDGVAELREILGLWAAGRRDEASLALGRLRCAKPHVPIPPDLPVPSPMPLRCPDGGASAKEAPPGDR